MGISYSMSLHKLCVGMFSVCKDNKNNQMRQAIALPISLFAPIIFLAAPLRMGRRGGVIGCETWVVWAAEGNAFVGSRAPVVHRHWVMMAAFFSWFVHIFMVL